MPHASILLPSWHLEDVSRDHKEHEAAAILNAYAVATHPWVIAASFSVPRWTAAPSPGEIETDRIVILPEPSQAKLPSGWLAQAQEQGVIILKVSADREKSLAQVLAHPRLRELMARQLTEQDIADHSLLDRAPCHEPVFSAIGTCYLLTLLLSQAMYHYDNVDETRFSEFLLEAGRQAIRQETEKAADLLKLACEQLLESREKFYPVEAHLMDVCLLGEGVAATDLQTLAATDHPVNVLCTGEFLEQTAENQPEAIAALREAVQADQLGLLGGEYNEAPTPLLPLQTLRWQLEQGLASYRQHLGCVPKVWMRMRYGLSTQLPLMLKKVGIENAYHLVLDDGVYPDEEQSHFGWEGRSSSIVQAISRIPLSVENATSLLRIPERLAEAMNHDHLACAVLARWPKLKNPWFQDLILIQDYAPILGRFTRMDTFLEETDDTGHYTSQEQRFYTTPYLDQWTGRKQSDPISRVGRFWKLQSRLQVLSWLETSARMLGVKTAGEQITSRSSQLQRLGTDLQPTALDQLTTELEQEIQTALVPLAGCLNRGGASEPGYLILNPTSFPCQAKVAIPLQHPLTPGKQFVPRLEAAVKHLQPDGDQTLATIELPACGFARVRLQPAEQFRAVRSKVPLAGELFLQNEFFHVLIDQETGGIQRLRLHGSTENLLSQRLVFRLDGSAGTVPRGATGWGNTPGEPTYTKMVADSINTTQTGPVQGQIVVRGRLLTPDGQKQIAEFQQTYTVCRGVRRLQIETELQPQTLPTQLADRSYYAYRTAWAASAARVYGSLQQSQFPAGEKRIESTGPIQIEEDQQVVLIPDGLPFHQRTSHRMLDTLLIAAGETARTFRCDVAVNVPQPAGLAATTAISPLVVPTDRLPQTDSAWLYHVSAPSVQLVQLQPEALPAPASDTPANADANANSDSSPDPTAASATGSGSVFRFDFIETAGKHAVVKFTPVRKPKQAWEVDFLGNVRSQLTIENDQILFECLPCDYLSVRVMF